MIAGLRVDADTLRGTREGVPRLLSLLEHAGVRATFFFSVGPDNMGRHLWRLFRPKFLWKMIRTSAPSLYGWSILRCGVIGTGPDIGVACGDIIRRTASLGHEVGLHAWDHQRWQSMNMDKPAAIDREVRLGYDRLGDILGAPPTCSAAPAWRAPEEVIAVKKEYPFLYNSDCRGRECFIPTGSYGAGQPQVPVTLPTYDEIMGRGELREEHYNRWLLQQFKPERLNVLCIHAEVEGIAKAGLFREFLDDARRGGLRFTRLDEVLRSQHAVRQSPITMAAMAGREGLLSFQADEEGCPLCW